MAVIAVIAGPGTYLTSLGAMLDAHTRLGEGFVSNPALRNYAQMETRLVLAGWRAGRIGLAGGRGLEADCAATDLAEPRLVFLPAVQLGDPDDLASLRLPPDALDWLRAQAARGTPIGACGAAVLQLAAAGLLDDAPCAVSPRLLGPLARLAPRARGDADRPICRHRNLWTCAHDADNPALVLRLLGEAISPAVATTLALREPPGPEGADLLRVTDPVVLRAQLWIRDRFTQRFRVADLARELGLSHQSLIRRFKAAGLAGPREFAQQTRISSARAMLAETHRSVAEIAQLVGYSDIASFRRVFLAVTGQTPTAFRAAEHRRREPA